MYVCIFELIRLIVSYSQTSDRFSSSDILIFSIFNISVSTIEFHNSPLSRNSFLTVLKFTEIIYYLYMYLQKVPMSTLLEYQDLVSMIYLYSYTYSQPGW